MNTNRCISNTNNLHNNTGAGWHRLICTL